MNPAQLKLIQSIFLAQDGKDLVHLKSDMELLAKNVKRADVVIGTKEGEKTKEFMSRKDKAMDKFTNEGLEVAIDNIKKAREKLRGMKHKEAQEMMYKINVMFGMPAPRPPPAAEGRMEKPPKDWGEVVSEGETTGTSSDEDEENNDTQT